VGEAFSREELAVDAEADGAIADAVFNDPVAKKLLRLDKAKLTPAQKTRFDALLAGAVSGLLEN
jgi:hypothetical protein